MAPWADVDLLRANLIKACEEIFAKWGDKTPPSYRKQFDDYLAGERATLPSAFDFQVTFVKVFRDTFSQYADDLRWNVAKAEFEKYFFRASYWARES